MVPLVVINDIKLISDVLCSMRRCDVESAWYLHVIDVSKFLIFFWFATFAVWAPSSLGIASGFVSFWQEDPTTSELQKQTATTYTGGSGWEGGSSGTHAPPRGPISFIFMQLLGKKINQNNSFFMLNFGVGASPQENPGSATDIDLFILLWKMIGTWWSL